MQKDIQALTDELSIKEEFAEFYCKERKQRWNRIYNPLNKKWTEVQTECWLSPKPKNAGRAWLFARPSTRVIDVAKLQEY